MQNDVFTVYTESLHRPLAERRGKGKKGMEGGGCLHWGRRGRVSKDGREREGGREGTEGRKRG